MRSLDLTVIENSAKSALKKFHDVDKKHDNNDDDVFDTIKNHGDAVELGIDIDDDYEIIDDYHELDVRKY